MTVETEQYKGHMITVELDPDPLDPRREYDNLTEFHVLKSRYYLGEHQHRAASDIDAVVREAKSRATWSSAVCLHPQWNLFSLEPFYEGNSPKAMLNSTRAMRCRYPRARKSSENFDRKRWTRQLGRGPTTCPKAMWRSSRLI